MRGYCVLGSSAGRHCNDLRPATRFISSPVVMSSSRLWMQARGEQVVGTLSPAPMGGSRPSAGSRLAAERQHRQCLRRGGRDIAPAISRPGWSGRCRGNVPISDSESDSRTFSPHDGMTSRSVPAGTLRGTDQHRRARHSPRSPTGRPCLHPTPSPQRQARALRPGWKAPSMRGLPRSLTSAPRGATREGAGLQGPRP
jgi:hypothetical protein